MKILCVIPARMESTRLPRKMLLKILNKPLIQWVYEHIQECKRIDQLIVATDHQEIFNLVKSFDGEAMMTRS